MLSGALYSKNDFHGTAFTHNQLMKYLPLFFAFFFLIKGDTSSARQAEDFPLKIEITVDSLYTYPYKGLWFQELLERGNPLLPGKRVYKLKIKISNTGKRSAFLYMMTCSKGDHLLLDNKLVEFLFWGCDSNFLTVQELKEGGNSTFYMDVICNADYYTNTDPHVIPRPGPTRMGLKLIADIYDGDFLWRKNPARRDTEDKPERIIWSNALDL